MARLIDVEGVLRDKVWFCGGFVSDDFSMGYMEALDKVETVIRQAPTVDAVPVVHGRWVHVPSSDMMTGKAYKCSECNKMRYGSYMPNYCQCCGAKMDLEVE